MKKVTKIAAEVKPVAKRVAAYCRVSSDSDAQLESLEAQKRHYETYISSRDDWEFAGLYFDEGITGTKKEKRPELLRMISDCEAGKINFIITKSISRFSRNTPDCLEMVRRLLDLNIPIYFEKENLNTGSMDSELFLSILSSMAEGESVSISENSKWSIQKRFLNGTYKLSSAPFGYTWDGRKVVIQPEQAETVRWIFEQALSGKGTLVLAKELNEKGVPRKRGGRWNANAVRSILTNEKYVGDVIFQKTYTDSQFNRHINRGEKDKYLLSHHHEALISQKAFDAAQELLQQQSREKGVIPGSEKYKNRYCFTRRIICGECGSTFIRRLHTCSGTKYFAWCCRTHINDKSQCSMKYVEDEALKAAFVTMINKLIYAHQMVLKPYIDALRSASKDTSMRRIQQIQTLLMQNSDQRGTLARLMGQGYIDPPIYNEENNALLRQADAYRAEIEMLNKSLSSDTAHLRAAIELLRFTDKSPMLDAFDDELFEKHVERIVVESRNLIVFELKCGLKLKERI